MSDTLNQRDALKRCPLQAGGRREGGGIFLGGTWHFWLNENVGTTSQVLRGAAKRIHTHKHTHRQEYTTHTHTLTRAAAAVAARKWKMLAPGATKKSYEWSRHIFFFVAAVCCMPRTQTLAALLCLFAVRGLSVDRNRVWSAYTDNASLAVSQSPNLSPCLLPSVLVCLSLIIIIFPRKFSYLLSY